ncbi:hypothetical protein POTOM_021335 [Populus tomentosa]|uniref:Uncharacterized protein n=1 Tax=Populus tomentosa TaxID=118781 RepID=A0A8X7ZQY8_POPTO|nr:hypothetical protein POTOM_021335 [Populus tomentosa]
MEEENEMHVQKDKHVDTAGVLESSPNLKKCACAIEPDPDSIAAVKTMSSNQNKRIKMKCMLRMVNVLMALLSCKRGVARDK